MGKHFENFRINSKKDTLFYQFFPKKGVVLSPAPRVEKGRPRFLGGAQPVSPKQLGESKNLCVNLVQEQKMRYCFGKNFEKCFRKF